MQTIFLLLDSLEQYSAYRDDHYCSSDVQIVLIVNDLLRNEAQLATCKEIIRFVPFENGIPILTAADIDAAQSDWISFSTTCDHVISSLNVSMAADWIVSDWWASLDSNLPFRHERCLQKEEDYRLHVLNHFNEWNQLLLRAHDPAWLLMYQPISWLRKEWLLRSATSDECMTPCEWLYKRLLWDLEQQCSVRIAFLPKKVALLPILSNQAEEVQLQSAQSEMVNWLLVLLGRNPGQSAMRQTVLSLLQQHRPWLLTPRASQDSAYTVLAEVFRENCPEAPSLTQVLQQGCDWVLVAEDQFDSIQVVSRQQAEVWAQRANSLRPGAIRSEVVRIDRVVIMEAFDATWLDASGSIFQLMALYRQQDGRWVLPALLQTWPAALLDLLASMLSTMAVQSRRNELVVLDGGFDRELGDIGNGHFLPGMEDYSTLVQHTARYRFAAAQPNLGRVLDCASGVGYGWQVLSDGDSMKSYTGIDLNPDAIRFSRRFIPQPPYSCQFEDRLLNTLPVSAFDTVISFETIQHTDDPEIFLWDLSERLAQGGSLLLSLPMERWAGSHLNPMSLTNWNEQRIRHLCGRVFDFVSVIRLRLSSISPETFQSGLLHQGLAEDGEDAGFLIILKQPKVRQLGARVVVQRRFAMGDVLLTSSLFAGLRNKYPDHQLVMKTQVVEVFQGVSELDIVGGMSLSLRPEDVFINLDNAYEEARTLHIIEAYAVKAGVTAIAPQLPLLLQDYRLFAGKVLKAGWLDKPTPGYLVAIHMASASPDRIWPLQHWVKLLTTLQQHDIAVILLGGNKDIHLQALPRGLQQNIISMVAEGRIAETAAAIDVADVLVAPDSGLIHIANAVGTPVVGLFGMALPETRLSLRGESIGLIADIECKGCLNELAPDALPLCRRGHAYCMDELLPSVVQEAVEQLLSQVQPYQWQPRLLQALPLRYDAKVYLEMQKSSSSLQPTPPVEVQTITPSVSAVTLSSLSGLPLLPTNRSQPKPFVVGAAFPPVEKIRVGVLSGDILDGACMRLRLLDPFSLLSPWLDTVFYPGNGMYDCTREAIDIDAFTQWADVFVIQRAICSERNKNFVDKLFGTGKPIIFELDDWLPALPASHPQFNEFSPCDLWHFWLQHLPQCTAATVSTEPLAQRLRSLIPDVRVFPNSLSKAYYSSLTPRIRKPDEPITIGFAGTSTHVGDLRMINDALLRIQHRFGPDKIRFVFWGCMPMGFENASNMIVVNKSVPYPDYLKELNRLGLDIALAPLEESIFNHGKSDLKWLEYTAVGAAAVLSDVAAYQEAKRLELAEVVANDTHSWENAIARLIEDLPYRKQLQVRAYDYLQKYATMEGQIVRWVCLLQDILPPSLRQILDSYAPDHHGSINRQPVSLMSADECREWGQWEKNHQLREIDAEMMAERMMTQWRMQPSFLLIMTVPQSERERLAVTLESLGSQMYQGWKLIVLADFAQPDPIFTGNDTLGWLQLDTLDDAQLMCTALNSLLGEVQGDWVMLLPAGTALAPQLLLRLGDTIQAHPQALAIYTDHDSYTQPGCYVQPALKPDFSLDYLRAFDYIDSAVAFSYQGLASLGGFEPYLAAEQWNHLLRLAENYGLGVVHHLDEVLFHLPARVQGVDHQREAARRVALENHLQRLGIAATVSSGYVDNTLHVEYQITGTPLVSVIIPTRDKLEYLQPCVESLFTNTRYPHFELLIVDNGSVDPDTLHFYADLQQDYPGRVRIIDYPLAFNFSAQCNAGVAAAQGEFVLLLNNDTEVIQPEWLERLIGTAQRPEVGAVGPRLVYPEIGRIQHAGIVLGLPAGMLSVADHVHEKAALDEPGYMNRLLTEQNYSAVTAACLLVSREKYLAVNGFDASDLTVLFNDVDFCLKLQQQGLLNVFTPYVTLVHHHAKSIGKQTFDPTIALNAAVREQKELDVMLKRWLPTLAHDPAYNRHLSLRARDMAIENICAVNWLPQQQGRTKVLGLPVAGGSGEYRVSLPFNALQQGGRLDTNLISPVKGGAMPVMSVVEMARLNPEVLLVHTILSDGMQHALQQYREYLPQMRVVFGLDDLVGALPEKSVLHRIWRKTMPDARPRLRAVLKNADSLIVSTEPLVDACRDMIDDIHVIPNRLARSMWDGLQTRRGRGRKPRVGWVGAQQHQGDLALILDVVKQTAHEVDWVFMGMCLPEMRPYIAEEHGWVPFQDYPAKVAALNLDLAIAPLEVNTFNESKSNLRLLEYGAMRWPVICTDIYPYQTNNAPVCRVPNTTQAWVEAIRARVHDLDAAYREGDALRAWVDRHYWIEDHLDDWQQALTGQLVKK